MRRKLLTYTLLAAIAGVVLWACQRDRFGHGDPNAVEPTLTVNEAQSIFESQMTKAMPALTKLPSDKPTGLMPGDFTPLWNKARIGANPELDGADVPIDPTFIFTATFNRVTPQGDTVQRVVDITQKLVVKKWRDSTENDAFSYIASIVPTPEYYAKHKNVGKEFQYAGSKGEFTGFVIYQTLDGVPVAIDNYRQGKFTRHDYFPHITEQNIDSVTQVMSQAMETTAFMGGRMIDFDDDLEEPVKDWGVVSNTVTVTHKRPDKPWLITIFYRPIIGLPNPVDVPVYNTPDIHTGGGGGSGDGSHVISTGKKPNSFMIKCSEIETDAKSASTALFSVLSNCMKNTDVNNSIGFNDFTDIVKSQPDVEHSTTMQGYVGNGGISLLPLQHAGSSEESININYNINSIAMVHSHPTAHQTQPSASDIMELGRSLDYSPRMQASYVFVGNDVYCLQVTDPEKAKAFYKNNYLDEHGHDFDPNSQAGGYWQLAQTRMSSMTGFSANERSSAGLALVLELSDAGIVLSRKGVNATKFEAYGVRPDQNGDYWPTKCQ